mgnify:CR=1 FL=1
MSLVFALMILPKPEEKRGEPLHPVEELLRYSFPLAFSSILGMVLTWSDVLLLG